MRCSPLVRISRSGSGRPAVSSYAGKAGLVDLVRHHTAIDDILRKPAGRANDFFATP